MKIRSVLLLVDANDTSAGRLDLAMKFAADHDTELSAVYVLPPPFSTVAMTGGYAGAQFAAEQEARDLRDARKVETSFLARAKDAGFSAELRIVRGSVVEQTAKQARRHDLVVVGKIDEDSGRPLEPIDLPAHIAIGAGRPVLVIPKSGAGDRIGKHVLVAWNSGREAARAVSDALPVLKKAEKVTVLAASSEDSPARLDDTIPGMGISLYLTRHGVNAECDRVPISDRGIGESILSHVADVGADMIVMGCYGRSRLRELLMGGATRYMLQNMPVPVMFSH